MGGFQLASMGKNKKVIENSPASILAWKGQRVKTKYIWSEMANFDYDFCFE